MSATSAMSEMRKVTSLTSARASTSTSTPTSTSESTHESLVSLSYVTHMSSHFHLITLSSPIMPVFVSSGPELNIFNCTVHSPAYAQVEEGAPGTAKQYQVCHTKAQRDQLT